MVEERAPWAILILLPLDASDRRHRGVLVEDSDILLGQLCTLFK